MIISIKNKGFISSISATGEVEFRKTQRSAKNFYTKTGQKALRKVARLFGKDSVVKTDVKHAPRGRNGGRRAVAVA
jgi:succinyl-CoA synthetase beta subunit